MNLARNHKIGLALAATGFVADQALKLLVNGPLGLESDGEQIVLTRFSTSPAPPTTASRWGC